MGKLINGRAVAYITKENLKDLKLFAQDALHSDVPEHKQIGNTINLLVDEIIFLRQMVKTRNQELQHYVEAEGKSLEHFR